jgi:hypothetical protein
MLKKQTAVQWLWRWINDNQEATIEQGNKAFEQAKAMEKVQIIDAYFTGMVDERTNKYKGIELYYIENFKKD